MLSVRADAAILLVHRLVGYPLAFVVAPLALASFAGRAGHRTAGKLYVVLMTFLYLTGTTLTLTRHAWLSWDFARNVAFNLLGYSLVLGGFRAMWLFAHPGTPRPAAVDRALLALQAALAASLVALALTRAGPIAGIALVACVLVGLEVRDWRAGFTSSVLYRRHVRCIVASYFYVLTVVSLVHLRDEFSSDVRWLWPSVIGALVLAAVRPVRTRTRTVAVGATIVVALAFGVYAGWEVVTGRADTRSAPTLTERP